MHRVIFFILLLPTVLSYSQNKEQEKRERQVQEYTSKGYTHQQKDAFARAEANYRKALSKKPSHTAANYNLGNAYYEKDKYGEAARRYVQAVEEAATKAEKHKAFHNLGNVMMNREDYAAAVEAYKNALRNNPRDDETRYNLALAKKMLEDNPPESGNDDDDEQDDSDQQQEDSEDEQEEEGEDEEQDRDSGEDEDESDDEQEDQSQGSPDEPDEDEQEGQTQPMEGQLTPEQLQNLLEATENEERKVQEKMQAEERKGAPARTDKDW